MNDFSSKLPARLQLTFRFLFRLLLFFPLRKRRVPFLPCEFPAVLPAILLFNARTQVDPVVVARTDDWNWSRAHADVDSGPPYLLWTSLSWHLQQFTDHGYLYRSHFRIYISNMDTMRNMFRNYEV
jgi:hypothetical protein